MKILTALLLFFAATFTHGAEEISSILNAESKQPDPEKIQKFIDWAEPAIGEFPTHFKTEEDKKKIVAATAKVTEEIKSISPEKLQDISVLTTLAYILAMGHNVDLRTFPYARAYYERALAVDPENVRANYLFGMFLISTDRYHFDSLPYLQKALALGERDAQFSIAMLYYQKGDKVKAIQQMEEYGRSRPKDNQLQKLIETMKNGTLEFSKPQTPPSGGATPGKPSP